MKDLMQAGSSLKDLNLREEFNKPSTDNDQPIYQTFNALQPLQLCPWLTKDKTIQFERRKELLYNVLEKAPCSLIRKVLRRMDEACSSSGFVA